MLNDSQIEELAGKMNIPLEGVYFKDALPSKLKYNRAYVLNMEDELDHEGKPNDGSHWVALQIFKNRDGRVEPIYFDSFGIAPPRDVSAAVTSFCGKHLPHCSKDVQSLVSSMCGWYVLAFLHFINAADCRTGHPYSDTAIFLDMFSDLGVETDHLRNEFLLKHFFRSADPALRVPIEVS